MKNPSSIEKLLFLTITILFDNIQSKLVMAGLFVRHGERAPSKHVLGKQFYTQDQFNKDFAIGRGELNKEGALNMVKLGMFLRTQYVSEYGENNRLLSNHYNTTEIEVLSSDFNRTLMSAYSLLLGMYSALTNEMVDTLSIERKERAKQIMEKLTEPHTKENDDESFIEDLNKLIFEMYQPVPVHTAPFVYDMFIAHNMHCPALHKIEQNDLAGFINENYYNEENYAEISKIFDYKTSSIFTAQYIYDEYSILKANKLLSKDSKTVTEQEEEMIKRVYIDHMTWRGNSDFQKKLFIGPLLDNLLTAFHRKILYGDTVTRKMNLYSAHDIHLIIMLNALLEEVRGEKGKKVKQGINFIPNYASSIILELHFHKTHPLFQHELDCEHHRDNEHCYTITLCYFENDVHREETGSHFCDRRNWHEWTFPKFMAMTEPFIPERGIRDLCEPSLDQTGEHIRRVTNLFA